jgi:hypothetical protein
MHVETEFRRKRRIGVQAKPGATADDVPNHSDETNQFLGPEVFFADLDRVNTAGDRFKGEIDERER